MSSRTDLGKLAGVICFGLFLVSCATSMVEGEKWLSTKNDSPEINISGSWSATEWGSATFKQQGREVTGTLGDYPVKGVVSGNSIYLLMYDGNKVDYFADLKAVDRDTLQGTYSKYDPVEKVRALDPKLLKSLILKRRPT